MSANRPVPQAAGIYLALAAGLLLVCVTACEPPGKPGPEEIAPENITDFKTLYQQNCSACHGPDGKNGPGRILNNVLYLAIIPRDALKQVIQHGRPGTSMPAWDQREGGTLSPKQIDALVNGIETNWAKPLKSSTRGLAIVYRRRDHWRCKPRPKALFQGLLRLSRPRRAGWNGDGRGVSVASHRPGFAHFHHCWEA